MPLYFFSGHQSVVTLYHPDVLHWPTCYCVITRCPRAWKKNALSFLFEPHASSFPLPLLPSCTVKGREEMSCGYDTVSFTLGPNGQQSLVDIQPANMSESRFFLKKKSQTVYGFLFWEAAFWRIWDTPIFFAFTLNCDVELNLFCWFSCACSSFQSPPPSPLRLILQQTKRSQKSSLLSAPLSLHVKSSFFTVL